MSPVLLFDVLCHQISLLKMKFGCASISEFFHIDCTELNVQKERIICQKLRGKLRG
jgi:hypothetical protein